MLDPQDSSSMRVSSLVIESNGVYSPSGHHQKEDHQDQQEDQEDQEDQQRDYQEDQQIQQNQHQQQDAEETIKHHQLQDQHQRQLIQQNQHNQQDHQQGEQQINQHQQRNQLDQHHHPSQPPDQANQPIQHHQHEQRDQPAQQVHHIQHSQQQDQPEQAMSQHQHQQRDQLDHPDQYHQNQQQEKAQDPIKQHEHQQYQSDQQLQHQHQQHQHQPDPQHQHREHQQIEQKHHEHQQMEQLLQSDQQQQLQQQHQQDHPKQHLSDHTFTYNVLSRPSKSILKANNDITFHSQTMPIPLKNDGGPALQPTKSSRRRVSFAPEVTLHKIDFIQHPSSDDRRRETIGHYPDSNRSEYANAWTDDDGGRETLPDSSDDSASDDDISDNSFSNLEADADKIVNGIDKFHSASPHPQHSGGQIVSHEHNNAKPQQPLIEDDDLHQASEEEQTMELTGLIPTTNTPSASSQTTQHSGTQPPLTLQPSAQGTSARATQDSDQPLVPQSQAASQQPSPQPVPETEDENETMDLTGQIPIPKLSPIPYSSDSDDDHQPPQLTSSSEDDDIDDEGMDITTNVGKVNQSSDRNEIQSDKASPQNLDSGRQSNGTYPHEPMALPDSYEQDEVTMEVTRVFSSKTSEIHGQQVINDPHTSSDQIKSGKQSTTDNEGKHNGVTGEHNLSPGDASSLSTNDHGLANLPQHEEVSMDITRIHYEHTFNNPEVALATPSLQQSPSKSSSIPPEQNEDSVDADNTEMEFTQANDKIIHPLPDDSHVNTKQNDSDDAQIEQIESEMRDTHLDTINEEDSMIAPSQGTEESEMELTQSTTPNSISIVESVPPNTESESGAKIPELEATTSSQPMHLTQNIGSVIDETVRAQKEEQTNITQDPQLYTEIISKSNESVAESQEQTSDASQPMQSTQQDDNIESIIQDGAVVNSQPMDLTQQADDSAILEINSKPLKRKQDTFDSPNRYKLQRVDKPYEVSTTTTIPLADTSIQSIGGHDENDDRSAAENAEDHVDGNNDYIDDDDDDDDYAPVSLTQFLKDIGVRFYDDLDIGTHPANRIRLSLIEDEPKDEDFYKASTKLPLLEVFKLSCKELIGKIEQDKKQYDTIKNTTFPDNQHVLRDYYKSGFPDQLNLKAQFQLLKEYARQQAKEVWYNWRIRLMENILTDLGANFEILENDKVAILDNLAYLNSVSDDIKQKYFELKSELDKTIDLQKHLQTFDIGEIKSFRTKLVNINDELQSYQQKLVSSHEELSRINAMIAEKTEEVGHVKDKVSELERRLKDHKQYDTQEIELLASKFKCLQALSALKFVHTNEGSVCFEFQNSIHIKVNLADFNNPENISYSLVDSEITHAPFRNSILLSKVALKLPRLIPSSSVLENFNNFKSLWKALSLLDSDIYRISLKLPVEIHDVEDDESITLTIRYYSPQHRFKVNINVSLALEHLRDYPSKVDVSGEIVRAPDDLTSEFMLEDVLKSTVKNSLLTSHRNIRFTTPFRKPSQH